LEGRVFLFVPAKGCNDVKMRILYEVGDAHRYSLDKLGGPPQGRGWRGCNDASGQNKAEEIFLHRRLGQKRDQRKSTSPAIFLNPDF